VNPYSLAAILAALLVLVPSAPQAQALRMATDKPIVLAQSPPPLPQPSGVQFYYNDGGKVVGPVSLSEIQAEIAAGVIKPDTLVWKTGTPNWIAAKQLSEIATLFTPGPSPDPVPGPKPAPTPAAAPVASSCTGKVLLSDNFRQVDDTWGTDVSTDAVTVEDGKVKIKADPNSGHNVLYGGVMFVDFQLCVTAQTPNKMGNAKEPAGGPVFWAEDYSNFYTFNIAPDGTAAVLRKIKGRFVPVIAYRKADAIKTQPGDKNQLRVTTSGGNITAYINGVKFATAKAQVPDGGGRVGLRAESEKGQRDTWKFSDFKVTDLGQ
jgi:hypothetical protein